MPFDPSVVATISLAGAGAAAAAIRYVVKLENRLTTHEETDKIVHQNISEALVRVEANVTRLVDTLITQHAPPPR